MLDHVAMWLAILAWGSLSFSLWSLKENNWLSSKQPVDGGGLSNKQQPPAPSPVSP